MSDIMLQLPELQGHKKLIWEELSFPRTLKTLYKVLNIPKGSIRRCLYEMKRDGYIEKRNKWRRIE